MLLTYFVPPSQLERFLPKGLELAWLMARLWSAWSHFGLVKPDFWHSMARLSSISRVEFAVLCQAGRRPWRIVYSRVCAIANVSWVARWFDNEPYRTVPLTHDITENDSMIGVDCQFSFKGKQHRMSFECKSSASFPAKASSEHYLKELHWGFSQDRQGHLQRYEVIHPIWRIYSVQHYSIALNWGMVYAPNWLGLNKEKPWQVMLAEGSEVKVFPHQQQGG